jgi:hypothetical protein
LLDPFSLRVCLPVLYRTRAGSSENATGGFLVDPIAGMRFHRRSPQVLPGPTIANEGDECDAQDQEREDGGAQSLPENQGSTPLEPYYSLRALA